MAKDTTDPVSPRPRGRPRVEEPKPGVTASTWLQPCEYDKLVRLANQQETSVSALVRQLLVLKLR